MGFINIEQNRIIKIFSVVSVVFLPPTLVASSYGMNFEFMPELHWSFGYPGAIVFMMLAGLAPYLYFKRKTGCGDKHPDSGAPSYPGRISASAILCVAGAGYTAHRR